MALVDLASWTGDERLEPSVVSVPGAGVDGAPARRPGRALPSRQGGHPQSHPASVDDLERDSPRTINKAEEEGTVSAGGSTARSLPSAPRAHRGAGRPRRGTRRSADDSAGRVGFSRAHLSVRMKRLGPLHRASPHSGRGCCTPAAGSRSPTDRGKRFRANWSSSSGAAFRRALKGVGHGATPTNVAERGGLTFVLARQSWCGLRPVRSVARRGSRNSLVTVDATVSRGPLPRRRKQDEGVHGRRGRRLTATVRERTGPDYKGRYYLVRAEGRRRGIASLTC